MSIASTAKEEKKELALKKYADSVQEVQREWDEALEQAAKAYFIGGWDAWDAAIPRGLKERYRSTIQEAITQYNKDCEDM